MQGLSDILIKYDFKQITSFILLICSIFSPGKTCLTLAYIGLRVSLNIILSIMNNDILCCHLKAKVFYNDHSSQNKGNS